MRHAAFVTLGLVFCASASPLSAQNVPSNYRFIETKHAVSVFAGYLGTRAGSLDLGPDPAPLFGTRYDIALSGPISGEVALGFSPTERTVYRAPTTIGNPLIPLGQTNVFLVIAEAGFKFQLTGPRTWHGIAPFGAISVGGVHNLTKAPSIEAQIPADEVFKLGPGIAAGFGLGTEFYLSERLSFRLEGRDHLWRLTLPAGLSGTGSEEKEWLHNFAVTLGGGIHF